jgi:drug/metabolite transporter (DMT)-like permease
MSEISAAAHVGRCAVVHHRIWGKSPGAGHAWLTPLELVVLGAIWGALALIGASRTSTVTYLIPLFGVLWAWLILDEALTWSMAVA